MANFIPPTNPTFNDRVRKFETTDAVHADVFNAMAEALFDNECALQANKANSTHTHTKSDITDFPTSLPANGGNAATVNNLTVQTAVPANAKFTDTTYESKSAASGGTAVSLVTTGEKYTWNNKAGTSVATTSANGLMSSTDKSKLDGIAAGANAYSLPTASSSVLGGVKIGTGVGISSGAISVSYGTAAGTACQGNDSRLSNARTPTAHNQAASTITAGTLGGKVQANATAAATLTNAQVRDIYAGTSDLTAGTSALTTGTIYLVYE